MSKLEVCRWSLHGHWASYSLKGMSIKFITYPRSKIPARKIKKKLHTFILKVLIVCTVPSLWYLVSQILHFSKRSSYMLTLPLLWRITDESHLRGERTYWTYGLSRDTGHYNGNGMVTGTETVWPHCIHSPEVER